jgi:charged multivesicular body protein 7
LPAIFHEAVQRKEMLLVKDFVSSTTSIYKTSWLPTPWSALQWSLRTVGVLGEAAPPDKLAVRNYVVIKNVEVAGDEILKKMKEYTSTADRVLSRRDFLGRFSHTLNPASPLTNNDLNMILIYLCRDKQAISYDAQIIKFKAEHEALPLPITEEDAAIVGLRDTLANIHAQLPPLIEKIELANAAAREAVATKQMVRAKAALRSKKLAETALAQRSDVALQLEGVYHQLQQAADQVEIVEAMRAGAAALKGLNEKVGGAEGVQGVVDAVNEQMAATEEITNIINETDTAVDEVDIEEEFEALERAETEKKEQEEAAKTAARLAQLEEAERKEKEKQAKEQQAKEQQAKEQQAKEQQEKEQQEKEQQAKEDVIQQDKQTAEEVVEDNVEQASQGIAQISFIGHSLEDSEEEREREPAYA